MAINASPTQLHRTMTGEHTVKERHRFRMQVFFVMDRDLYDKKPSRSLCQHTHTHSLLQWSRREEGENLMNKNQATTLANFNIRH